MPTENDRGLPLYSDTEPMPDWDIAYNAQSNALSEALDAAEQAEKDNDSVATIAALPVTGNWTGRQIFVEETGMLYLHDGAGWYAVGGKVPYYFGTRSDSAIGTGGSPQAWVTTTTEAQGITMSDGELTFEVVGKYRIDQTVIWEANGNGQRNCGLDCDAGASLLGMQEAVLFPNAYVEASQDYTSYFRVTTPGAKATPYVTHNTGEGLDVYGTVCVMWVSA